MKKLNIILKDEDLGLEATLFNDDAEMRYAARGIVVDPKTNKIAISVKTKIHEYKLPGGGMEKDESPEDTFMREVFEETGCRVEILQKLGTVFEERSVINMKQESIIFVAEVIENTGELILEKGEIDEGMHVEWMSVEEAIKMIDASFDVVKESKYESIHSKHFVLRRDKLILEFYQLNNS